MEPYSIYVTCPFLLNMFLRGIYVDACNFIFAVFLWKNMLQFVLLLVGIWFVSSLELLQTLLLWTFLNMLLGACMLEFHWGYSRNRIAGSGHVHIITLILDNAKMVSSCQQCRVIAVVPSPLSTLDFVRFKLFGQFR